MYALEIALPYRYSSEAKPTVAEQPSREEFMSPEEFETLSKHIEVVLEPNTGPLGNLTRLEDTPDDDSTLPVKRYRISVGPDMGQMQIDQSVVRYLGVVRRDLTSPHENSLGKAQEAEDQLEKGIQDFVQNHLNLVRKIPVYIFESGSPNLEPIRTTGLNLI